MKGANLWCDMLSFDHKADRAVVAEIFLHSVVFEDEAVVALLYQPRSDLHIQAVEARKGFADHP